ncbi:MAG: dynamin family protein [Pseudomonadota bacterium]
MSDPLQVSNMDEDGPARKPRIGLMGEFSAGKSTLLNMLLTGDPLPVKVTATNAPPVWISHGSDAAVRVLVDGTEETIDPGDLESIGLQGTKFVRLYMQSDALEICDLIDMPGISDPNMSSDVWKQVFDEVDCVIWCTHATQAWRQSEAAVWAEIEGQTNGNNILVVTQFDKIKTERDRARLIARVKKETNGLFEDVFPLALMDAINASNEETWKDSGAAAFSDFLVEMLLRREEKSSAPIDVAARAMGSDQGATQICKRNPAPGEDSDKKVVPRRVRLHPGRERTNRNQPEHTAPPIF